MKNKYKAEYDSIKLTQQQKNTLIAKMQEAKTDKKIIYLNRKTFTRAIAACLAIAVICTGFFFTKITPKNRFTIIANAAEVQTLGEDAIGIFNVDDNISTVTYRVTDGIPEFTGTMSAFGLTEFAVQGSNIKSIAIQSNDKYCQILADPVVESPNFDAEKYNIDEFSIGSSIKNEEGFIYENKNITGKTQTFRFDNLTHYVIRPNMTDPEISEWIKKIDEICMGGPDREKGLDENGNKLTKDEINKLDRALTEESHKLTDNYHEKMLRDATIDVAITFTDGTTQTQTLDVDLILSTEGGDIIYDEKDDDYSTLKYNAMNSYTSIVFRYAE